MGKDIKYKVELSCDYAQWWRYNVYIMVAEFDAEGNRLGISNLSDHIYDAECDVSRSAPEGYDPVRPIAIESTPCAYIEVYAYIVANTFPESTVIKDNPPFDITLSASADGKPLEQTVFSVNQWGGLTIVAHRVSADFR